MLIYLLLSVLDFAAICFDNWIYGNDLTKVDAFAFMCMSLFPVMNVFVLVVATFRIISKLIPNVLLKGKK